MWKNLTKMWTSPRRNSYTKLLLISVAAFTSFFTSIILIYSQGSSQANLDEYYLPMQELRKKRHVISPDQVTTDEPIRIWPINDGVETNDRIVEQLYKLKAISKRPMKIFLHGGPADANSRLHEENCPVTDCKFTHSRISANKIYKQFDAIIFFNYMPYAEDWMVHRSHNQIWVLYLLESPHHTGTVKHPFLFNWTATYRRDSVITTPYEKFVFFDNYTGSLPLAPKRNYAEGKTKLVAWFVSNCNARNGRDKYAKELQKYIDVDIFGDCGSQICPRYEQENCYKLLRTTYKFYLAFENSNCKDYITEKLYWNAYQNDVIPIVMGAHPDDYRAVAPPHSYIHVDDFESPKELAKYLHKLDKDDKLYNSYFRWKGTGHFINTKFWCRVCNLVHEAHNSKRRMSYKNFDSWWSGPGICTRPHLGKRWATWRKHVGHNYLTNIKDNLVVYS